MKFFGLSDSRLGWAMALVIGFFILISLPLAGGKSSYAHSELGRDMTVVKQIDAGHLVSLGPVSSLGSYHFGPAYYYLSYPFAKVLNFAPYSLAIASSFFMLLTILLTFVAVRKWFQSDFMAVLGAGLTATSILTFQLTKYGSNPNFIPFFTILFFYSLSLRLEKSRNWLAVIGVSLAVAVLTQLHAVPLVAVPIILLSASVIFKFRNIDWQSIGIFAGVNAILYAPYLVYEFSHGFSNTLSLFHLAGSGGDTWELYLTRIFGVYGFFINTVLSVHTFFDSILVGGSWYKVLLIGFVLGGLMVWLFEKFFSKNRDGRVSEVGQGIKIARVSNDLKKLFKLWIIVPAIILLLPFNFSGNFQYYYFFLWFPLAFIFLAWIIMKLKENNYRWLTLYILTAYIIVQAIQMVLYLRFINFSC